MPDANEVRCVVFMTQRSAPQIPVPEPGMPAALLPLGAATFAEKVIESCATAGIREIDLVTSDAPEALRAVIGDGWRWDVKLRWHTVRDADAPYGILSSIDVFRAPRVIIGHAEHWISPSLAGELLRHNLAVTRPHRRGWGGWVSMPGLLVHAIPPNGAYAACEQVALAMYAHVAEAGPGEYCSARSPRDLLAAQAVHLADAPPTWKREKWGIASPLAHVHPQARITGPVLAGPGAVIERGAQVGPNAVICGYSVVTRGAKVRDTVVLPHTWVGHNLLLEDGIAQGGRWLNVRLGVELDGDHAAGLLSDLREAPRPRPSMVGRLAAGVASLCLLGPWAVARLSMGPAGCGIGGWDVRMSVQGRDRRSGSWQERPVRVALQRSLAGRIAGLQGGLLDIVQGSRSWVGMRPRDAAAWRALPQDWQGLLSTQPVGLLHAPAWDDPWTGTDATALAAADAFLGVARSSRGSLRRRLRVTRFSLA